MTVDLSTLPGPISTMPAEHLQRIAAIGVPQHFTKGAAVITADGNATEFHVLISGRLQVGLRNTRAGGIVIQTLGPGDIAGLSWYSPPHRWNWDVTAALGTDVLTVDAGEARTMMARDTAFRASLSTVIVTEMHQRLVHTRLQLLDLYGHPGEQT